MMEAWLWFWGIVFFVGWLISLPLAAADRRAKAERDRLQDEEMRKEREQDAVEDELARAANAEALAQAAREHRHSAAEARERMAERKRARG